MEVTRARQSGFTIIEAMVSMTILLIGLLALAMLQNVAYKANTTARNRMAATILASQQIERMSRLGAGNFATGTGTMNVDGRNFSQNWLCSAAPSVTNSAQVVDMKVQWTDQWGAQTVRFPTVVR